MLTVTKYFFSFSLILYFMGFKSWSSLFSPSVKWLSVIFFTVYYLFPFLESVIPEPLGCQTLMVSSSAYVLSSVSFVGSSVHPLPVYVLWFLAHHSFHFILGRSQTATHRHVLLISQNLKTHCINWLYLKIRIFNMKSRFGFSWPRRSDNTTSTFPIALRWLELSGSCLFFRLDVFFSLCYSLHSLLLTSCVLFIFITCLIF